MAVSIWPFVKVVRAAWKPAADGSPAVDSVVEGCSACEELRCDGTVGAGGSPDEYGETTLDALVMNGHPTGTFVHLSSVEKPLHVCLDDLEKCYGDKKGQSFSLWLDKVTFVQISSDSWKVKFDKWELAGEDHVGCSTTVLLILKNQMDSCGCMYNRLG